MPSLSSVRSLFLPRPPTLVAYWWMIVLVALVGFLLTEHIVRGYVTLAPSFAITTPPLNTDSALFQHAGWYMTQGAVPYVDIWDVKPPLIYYLTTALSFLAGGDMAVLHLLSVLASALGIFATVILVGTIVHDLTGDDVAAIIGGGAMLTLPYLYTYPVHGIRPKYFTLAFGAGALVLALRDRSALAGAAAAIAAGFWQFGAIFFLLVIGMAGCNRRSLMRVVAAGVTVAVLTIIPFAAWGALVPLAVETVIAPIDTPSSATALSRLYNTIDALGYATVLVPFVTLGPGVFWAVNNGGGFGDGDTRLVLKRLWWLPAGGLLFAVQVLLLDGEGWPDSMTLLVFVALAAGVFAASQSRTRQWILVGAIVTLILAGPVWASSPSAPLKDDFATLQQNHPAPGTEKAESPLEDGRPSMQEIYWQQTEPKTCHYRFAGTEVSWARHSSASLTDSRCGRWPS